MERHRDELGSLRESLRSEVKTLQDKFLQLKTSLQTQLEETTAIATQENEIAAQWTASSQ